MEDGISEIALDQSIDRAIERCGKEQRLVRVFGDTPQHPLDLGHETHVGHAVGFVQDQHVEVLHVELAAISKINQATGRRDDDVTAPAKRLDLALNVGATIHSIHV